MVLFAANHRIEHRNLNGGFSRTKGAKGFATPKEEQQYQSTRPPTPSSQIVNHQPKSTHGGTYGSSYGIVGNEALGPVKARCTSVGEC